MSTPRLKDHKQSKQIIDRQVKNTKVKRLVHHLSVGMSLIADATVRASVNESIPVPASTQQQARQWKGMYGKKGKVTKLTSFKTDFNPNFLPLDNLLVWLGIAWHELGHALWSPFDKNISVTIGLNLLEDARIETLIILKYPKMKAAIQAALAHLMQGDHVNNTIDAAYSYAWVVGRSHLSSAVRNEARKMLVKVGGEEGRLMANEIDQIFRDYLSMGSSLDLAMAQDLATQLNALLGQDAPTHKTCSTSMTDTGSDANAPDVDVPDDVLDDVGSEDEDESDTGTDGTGSLTEDEGDDTDTDDVGNGASNAVPDLDPLTQEAREERKRETDALRDKVQEELDEASSNMSEELMEEVSKLERLIDIVGGAQGAEIDVKVDPPSPQAKGIARDITRIAAKFNDDSAKGLMRRRDHGRFKPARYERFEDLDVAYDQWEPGLSQEMYIAMCMDISGSMDSRTVTNVLYGLEVGLQDVATTDIALFNDTVRVPAQHNSHTKMVQIRTTGGTYPNDAMTYLYTRIRRAHQQNKLLVFYTDGVFSNDSSYQVLDSYISELKREGVNVRVLVDPRADVAKMEAMLTGLVKGQDLHVIQYLEDLPEIVLSWTRSILTGSIV